MTVTSERVRADQDVRDRCRHPTGAFDEFPLDAVERSIPARFEAQVERFPNRLAVVGREGSFTYAELNRVANRVAHALLERGGPRGTSVGLLLEGEAFIAGSLGAIKAGVIHVPLDRDFPHARLVYMLDQSGAGAILTDGPSRALARELAGTQRRVLDFDEIRASGPSDNLGLRFDPLADLAIEYTSGSTGRPKGILRSHRGVLHDVLRHANMSRLCALDRMTVPGRGVVPPFHALLTGATFCPIRREADELSKVGAWLIDKRVTVYRSAVSTFRALVAGLSGTERFEDLRLIELFGEPVYESDVELYREHFSKSCILVSTLGASEFGDYAHYFVDQRTVLPNGVVPGGYVAAGVEVVLLDEGQRPVGEGHAGEIALKSRYGAKGYWKLAELTSAAFLADPDGGDRRLYRTGDIGRFDESGCLYHLGRRDFQVKIAGNRVHLSEVEAALLEHEDVKSAAVVGREDEPGSVRLIAYFVPSGKIPPTASALRRALAARLPGYMVPSAFVALDALPLTATGKIDRRVLPAPSGERPRLDTAYDAPGTPLEATLVGMFEEVLGIAGAGASDNFFELGGHSLLALQLVAEIDRRFGKRLPLAILLEAPSPRALAGILADEGWTPVWSSLVAVQSRGARPPLFCVPGHSGTILCFQELSRRLGAEQPLYGLEPLGLDGRFEPQADVEAIAEGYLKEIQGFQTAGPYCLAGYCFGGLVAYEMARRLREAGHAVGLVALFDAEAPVIHRNDGAQARPGRLSRIGQWLRVEYANLVALDPGDRVAYARDTLGYAAGRLAARVGRRFDDEQDPLIRKVADAQSLAARRYQPKSYGDHVVLYKAQHRLTRHFTDPWFGWKALVGERIEVRLIPANSGSIIQDSEGAAMVADDLRLRIARL